EALSAGAITISPHAPTVQILAPDDGHWYTPEQTIVLEGVGSDLEDGTLADEALHWASDKDGDLGSGASLAVTDLSPGYHTITLTATDSDEMSGTASITIFVAETLPPQSYLPLITRH
ncbi:MAG: hypothetical protein GXP38_09750, partial [Chloroflexi bacterium]|nr:hypothetical protein [Chloroflexota bacterium]